MIKRLFTLALVSASAACATTEAEAPTNQVCTTQPSEATGSRVQTETVCRPAE